MSKPKKPESQAFGLRFSVALAERVKALAEANKRTFNGQLVHLLEVGLSATTGEAQTSKTWGDSLATSAALAASEAARDAVLRVAREFDGAFTLAKADDVIEVHRNGLDMGLMAIRAAVELLNCETGPDVAAALDRLRNGALAELEPYLPAAPPAPKAVRDDVPRILVSTDLLNRVKASQMKASAEAQPSKRRGFLNDPDAMNRALANIAADYDEVKAAEFDSIMGAHQRGEWGDEDAAERRANADRRAPSADPDPDPPLPPGVLPVDVYPTDKGVKLGTRTKQRRSTPKPL